MMVTSETNRFLTSLSDTARSAVLEHAIPLHAPLRMQCYAADQKPEFAFFVTSGMVSIVATTEDGDTAEVGIIGAEGLIGSLHLIGPALVSTSAFVQLEGTVLRIPFRDLSQLFRSSREIHARVLEFVQEQALTVSHVAGCNRFHDAEARLARWLLMARDRTGTDILNFTQEFLGMMLGSRRTTVSLVAAALQRLGAIEYVRGRVVILDAPLLENLACDCYQIAKKLHNNLYRNDVVDRG